MRIGVPDLLSHASFPAVAAVALGFFAAAGLDVALARVFPAPRAMAAWRDGALDCVAGAAHATLMAFPAWQGARLVAA
jgi:NitT/TauT family transport system substrate-binding protein